MHYSGTELSSQYVLFVRSVMKSLCGEGSLQERRITGADGTTLLEGTCGRSLQSASRSSIVWKLL